MFAVFHLFSVLNDEETELSAVNSKIGDWFKKGTSIKVCFCIIPGKRIVYILKIFGNHWIHGIYLWLARGEGRASYHRYKYRIPHRV